MDKFVVECVWFRLLHSYTRACGTTDKAADIAKSGLGGPVLSKYTDGAEDESE